MKRHNELYLFLVICGLAGFFHEGKAQVNCLNAQSRRCAFAHTEDGETPSGQKDGQNTRFQLARSPASGLTVHVFRNGLEQRNDVDYQIEGANLTFGASAVPAPGDLVLITYTPVGTSGPLNSRSQIIQQEEQIIDRALQESLSREGSTSARTNDAGGQTLASTWADRLPKNSEPQGVRGQGSPSTPRSLSMLAQRLQETGLKLVKRYEGTGPEGLGDLPTASPFSFLHELSSTEPNRSLGNFGNASSTSSPQSLVMLEEALGRTDTRSGELIEKPNKLKKRSLWW